MPRDNCFSGRATGAFIGVGISGFCPSSSCSQYHEQMRVVLLAATIFGSLLVGLAEASTPLEKCGVVTAYDFVNVPGTSRVDDVSFVVGLPGGFRGSDVPTLTLPYAAIGLGTGVCVRGLVSPLRTNVWHLLSGEVVVTGRPVTSLPNTGTAPDNRALTLVLLLAVATLFGVRRAIRP